MIKRNKHLSMQTKAMIFAVDAHSSTNHTYDNKPYSLHLIMVVGVALKYLEIIPEQCRDEVLSACWLHDTIEDCRLTYDDIKSEFGETVAEIVYAVSNNKGKSRKERANDEYYQDIRKTAWATFVKLCDRLANIQYSKTTNSRMLDVYMREHFDFIERLLPLSTNKGQYTGIVNEMESLLFENNLK